MYLHFVMEDGGYSTKAGQPLSNPNNISFAGLARASGYAAACELDSIEEFVTDVEDIL